MTRRYSNLFDSLSKTLHILRTAGLIAPDGRPIPRSDRSSDQAPLAAPFKLDQRLKPAIVTDIVARYQAGEPSTAIAATFNISKGSVIKLLREAGIQIRNQPLTDSQITEAVRLYKSGQSLAQIGAHLGVDHGTVWRQLKKRGVQMRDTHGRLT